MRLQYAIRIATRVFLLSAMMLILTGVASGQDKKAEAEAALENASPEQVGERAAALMNQLDSIVAANKVYQERVLSANAEDQLVLNLQLADGQDRFMDVLHQLAAIAVESENADVSAELQSRVRTLFIGVTPEIWRLISEYRGQIDNLRSERGETAAADQFKLENKIQRLTTRLDLFYEFGLDHIQLLETQEIDTAEDRNTFNTLLSGRADELSGRLQLSVVRISEFKSRLEETPGDADLTALLTASTKNLETNSISMDIVLDLMETGNLATELYRAQLISTNQDLAAGLLDARVTATIVKRSWEGFTTWLVEKGPALLVKLLLFLAIIFIGRFLARLVRKAVATSLDRGKVNLSQLLERMIVNAAHNAVMGLAALVALSQLGISLGPLLAGFGVIGFILGFAMQDSLSNLAAGMMILVNRPYDVGDLVEISGVFGKVEEMSMVSTSILTLDNQKLIVPNSRIWGDVIKNVTDQTKRRVDLVFGISYNDDIPKAELILNDILSENDLVLEEPEPMVRLHTLGESSVDFVVRPWVKTDDYWDVHWAITRAVKMRFDQEGISIPFPQRDVHLYETKLVQNVEVERIEPSSTSTHAQDPDEIAGDEG